MVQVGDMTKSNQSVQNPVPVFVGTSKNLTDAVGTQAITGVGFSPTFAIVRIVQSGTTKMAFGFYTNSGGSPSDGMGAWNEHAVSAGTWVGSNEMEMEQGGGNDFKVRVASFDSDGITLDWYFKNGAPSGTAIVGVMLYK